MKLRIDNGWKIGEVKEHFNAEFPFLRLEIYRGPERTGAERGVNRQPLSEHLTLAQVREISGGEHLHIYPAMRVSELAEAFAKTFGLHAKVWRKSGKHWLETSKTDHWTLEKQNKEGENLSGE